MGLTADVLKQFFNAALVSASLHDAGIDGGEPIVDCNLGSEGKFGFLEFRTIAECTSCIALSGIELGGKALRVERPRDYAPMAETMTEALREAACWAARRSHRTARLLSGGGGAPPPPAAPPPVGRANGGGAPPQRGRGRRSAGGAAARCRERDAVVLENMVTAEELASEAEMAEVLDDTKVEAENHGRVVVLAALKPEATAAEVIEAAQYALKVLCTSTRPTRRRSARRSCMASIRWTDHPSDLCVGRGLTRLTSLPCYKTA